MKTIEEFIKEINGSEELAKEFNDYSERNELDEFFKKHDCDFTEEELNDFLIKECEISDDEAEYVAGGAAAPNSQSGASAECSKSPDGTHKWTLYWPPIYGGKVGPWMARPDMGRTQHKCIFCDLRVPYNTGYKIQIR